MEKSDVFRKVAIERLSSPEQLDQLLTVVRPRSWVALGGFVLVIAAILVWGITGSVPTTVRGSGVLIRTGGVSGITASGGGRVVDVAVKPGDVIQAHQVVARLRHPELEERLDAAQARLAELQMQHDQDAALAGDEVGLRLAHLDKRRRTVEQEVASNQESLQWLREKLNARRGLVDKGLMTRQRLVDTRHQLRAVEQAIQQGQAQIQQIDIERQTLTSTETRRTTARTFEVSHQQRLIRQLREEIRRKSRVVSPDKGRVVELRAQKGDLVRPGETLLSYSRLGRDVKTLEAALFVTARDGKKIRPGMTVQIAPATVRPEEYGRMVGVVTYVSDYPATRDGMMRLLQNERLVSSLTAEGAPYEVHADLLPALDTDSGYEWTSSGGPPTTIRTGTVCESRITVSTQRPVELVLPILKQSLGV